MGNNWGDDFDPPATPGKEKGAESWRDKPKKYVEIVGEVVHVTEKAIMVSVDGQNIWLPKSQLRDTGSLTEGYKGPIACTEWIAKKKFSAPGDEV